MIDVLYDFGYLDSFIFFEDGLVLVSIENMENFKGGFLKIDVFGNVVWIKMFFDFFIWYFNYFVKIDDQFIFLF